MSKVNIGIVGTGARGVFAFGTQATGNYSDRLNLVAFCDRNEMRLQLACERLGVEVETFTDYEEFLGCEPIDVVIVTTPDYTHAELSVRALEAGKHVLCEKPMATTAADARRMVETARKSPGVLQVGLNLRYIRTMEQIMALIRQGEIGEVMTVQAIETLEGGGHFARWHRKREYTGGILLQKGCHTLDLLNWIIGETPVKTAAFGGRDAFRPREECRERRCLTCPEKDACPEYRDVGQARDGFYSKFYLEAEKLDGYIVDRCVYDPDADILDNACVIIEYENGKRATYNLSLFAAEADRKLTIIGTKGKIEASLRQRRIVVYKRRSADVDTYEVGATAGGHGGGDLRLLDAFLAVLRGQEGDVLSNGEAGMWSVLVGLAGERSIMTGREVALAEL